VLEAPKVCCFMSLLLLENHLTGGTRK